MTENEIMRGLIRNAFDKIKYFFFLHGTISFLILTFLLLWVLTNDKC